KAVHVSTRTWPCSENDVTFPFASNDIVCAPAVTPTGGTPNRCASAGERTTPACPLLLRVKDPSGNIVSVSGPEMFEVTVFPVLRFVADTVNEPVKSMVPSAALRILPYALLTGKLSPIANPQ